MPPAVGRFPAGFASGETDEVGDQAAADRVSLADLHATIPHQLGLDHESLSCEHAGRDKTLTDPSLTQARVVQERLASASRRPASRA